MSKTKTFLKTLLCASALMAVAMNANAHRGWLLPSATALSGQDVWVSIDGAVSNTLFHADHAPMRTDGIIALDPKGNAVELTSVQQAKYRSTFDVQLKEKGTYRIASASSGLVAMWEENGERRMYPGRGEKFDAKLFEQKVPKKADKLQVMQNSRRLETFVTNGAPTPVQVTGKGLEIDYKTHPNDLFAEDESTFVLLIDGKPAANAKVEVIPGAMRYRDGQNSISATTDAKGQFSVTWPAAGMYWLSASYRDDKAAKPATVRSGSYVVTLEVLPQ